MSRILVVEDEEDLRSLLEFNLKAAGHDVVTVADGKAGLAAVAARAPDLILLDLMLPDGSGLDVCRKLKSDPATNGIPVVMVTAKAEEIDRVVGFELGADDYVTKPYSTRELILRLQVILRRKQEIIATATGAKEGGASDDAPAAPTATRFGKLSVDRGAHRVWVADAEVTLTALEFRLLCTLLDRKDRVQSRGSLLEEVWGANEDMATRTVDTHVKRLREKLGEAGDYIETVRGVGYRFLGEPPAGHAR